MLTAEQEVGKLKKEVSLHWNVATADRQASNFPEINRWQWR